MTVAPDGIAEERGQGWSCRTSQATGVPILLQVQWDAMGEFQEVEDHDLAYSVRSPAPVRMRGMVSTAWPLGSSRAATGVWGAQEAGQWREDLSEVYAGGVGTRLNDEQHVHVRALMEN